MVMKPPRGSGRPSQPDYEDEPIEKTVVMPGAPRTSRPGPLPNVPVAPTSDRVLLPTEPEPAATSPSKATVEMPSWVMFYVFIALGIAAVGLCVLFVESRIVGHW
jgi:hypothetical protein